mmetsp:Transcript_7978/g.21988  ORF Transcript_7978/g.21988 Transcript_7978/m.21988 type:complete len:225 (+) Transcript_7978:1102-1776(+)
MVVLSRDVLHRHRRHQHCGRFLARQRRRAVPRSAGERQRLTGLLELLLLQVEVARIVSVTVVLRGEALPTILQGLQAQVNHLRQIRTPRDLTARLVWQAPVARTLSSLLPIFQLPQRAHEEVPSLDRFAKLAPGLEPAEVGDSLTLQPGLLQGLARSAVLDRDIRSRFKFTRWDRVGILHRAPTHQQDLQVSVAVRALVTKTQRPSSQSGRQGWLLVPVLSRCR